MTASQVLQIININQAATTFALQGYHVTTSFTSSWGEMSVVIFFHRLDEKEEIESILLKYKHEEDKIEFDDFSQESKHSFYTLKLTKHPL